MSTSRARWGYQTGLFQRGMPAFWLYLVLVLLCGAVVGLIQVVYAVATPGPWLLSWALLLLYLVPVVVVVRWLDLYEREPRSMVIGAFLWGSTVAVVFASFSNVTWGEVITKLFGAEFASEWSAALTAPAVEESYKSLGVVVLYLIARSELDDLMDGFVYGAMIGLGFTVIEDIDYFIGTFGGTIAGVLEGFWVRVIASGLYGHVLYTGIAGIGIAYFVTRRGGVPLMRRLAVGLGAVLLAMSAHFFWNSPFIWEELPLLAATAVKGLPFLIVLFVALRLARRRERRWLGAALESEIGRPGLVAEELELLADPTPRKRAQRMLRAVAGRDAARLLTELQRRQVDLSMVATRIDRPDHPDLMRARNQVREVRERLWAMPGAIEALGIPLAAVEAVRRMSPEVPWEPDVTSPAGGLMWWAVPDGNEAARGMIEPNVPLMIVGRSGDWSQVKASNAWIGWVDARRLVQRRRLYWR